MTAFWPATVTEVGRYHIYLYWLPSFPPVVLFIWKMRSIFNTGNGFNWTNRHVPNIQIYIWDHSETKIYTNPSSVSGAISIF